MEHKAMEKKPIEMTTSCPCERNSRAMSKSRSWPMLYTVPEEETVGGASTAMAVTDGQQQPQQQHQLLPDKSRMARQLQMAAPAANVGRLLRRHYYPEAGWGWVVVACACMVHLLNHGLQLSFGALEKDVVLRFRDATYDRTAIVNASAAAAHVLRRSSDIGARCVYEKSYTQQQAPPRTGQSSVGIVGARTHSRPSIRAVHIRRIPNSVVYIRALSLPPHIPFRVYVCPSFPVPAAADCAHVICPVRVVFIGIIERGGMTTIGGDDDSSSGVVVSGGVVVGSIGSNGGPGLFRSRSLPHLLGNDSGVGGSFSDGGGGCPDGGVGGTGSGFHGGSGGAPLPGHCSKSQPAGLSGLGDIRQLVTLKQHYYPEGGWGWVVAAVAVTAHLLTHGLHLASGVFVQELVNKFGPGTVVPAGWLGAMSTGVALLLSPVTIAFCRRKSTRLTAVMGGLITALGCLFTSFATQFHQLFFSYGTVIGIGVGMTRDCSTLMVAQYFKRKREFVEIFIVSGSGMGIAVMSSFIKGAISAIGWRLGLQLVTATVFTTFLLGTCYRSASLYHPQRRAILHLKNQKRKIKDKNRHDDRPPFLDFTTLRSKTVRILLVSTGISAFGINTPIFYLAHQAEEDGLGDSALTLQVHMGLAWTVGCVAFGLIVVRNSVECRIARQYLCQASVFMCGVSILALTTVRGDRQGYVMFAWVYGMFCGGYHYSLKMYTYERVRARNFARTWGFVQCSQAIPIALGVPISGYINIGYGAKSGYYFSSACVLLGSLTMFFIDLHRRNVARHKHNESGTKKLCVSDSCPQRRRLSFTVEPEEVVVMEPPLNMQSVGLIGGTGGGLGLMMAGGGSGGSGGGGGGGGPNDKPELTCISEEGIADMDLPDNLLDDLDYIGDCITSCNKVENYLMLSEFENNLIAEMPVIMDRKGRRWSLAKQAEEETPRGGKWRLVAGHNSRMITVIDEASV